MSRSGWSLLGFARSLDRLRHRLGVLRDDIAFTERGGRILYAVDFSELYSYVAPGEDADIVHAGPDFDEAMHARHVRLGLEHLFRSTADTVYMLRPHVEELYNYVRRQTPSAAHAARARGQIERWWEQLDADEQALLERAAGGGRLNDHARERLVELVRGNFERVCYEAAEIVAWQTSGLPRLRELVDQGHLVWGMSAGLAAVGVTGLDLGTLDPASVQPIHDALTEGASGPQWSRVRDARALLALRTLEERTPDDVRVVLVTRDQKMRAAVDRLGAEDPVWQAVRTRFRSLETQLLSLTLAGARSPRQRLVWINETDDMLREMEDAVGRVARRRGVSQTDAHLDELAERLRISTMSLWEEHLSLRLGQAAVTLDWLEGMLDEQTARDEQAADVGRALWTFVKSDRFQERADSVMSSLRDELMLEAMRMLFAAILGPRLERVMWALTAGSQVVKRGERRHVAVATERRRYQMRCVLEFASPQYREALRRLKRWHDQAEDRLGEIRTVFLERVDEAVRSEPDSEGVLFMAFVFGMLDLWEEAALLAQHCRPPANRVAASEALYFQAFAERKLGERAKSDAEALQRYEGAWSRVREAAGKRAARVRHDRPEPRYLKEEATIALLFHEAQNPARYAVTHEPTPAPLGGPGAVTVPEAIALLERAAAAAEHARDERLLIEIHNNLAYILVQLDPPQVDRAGRHISVAMGIHTRMGADPEAPVPDEPDLALRETRLLVTATAARGNGDAARLRQCLTQYDALVAETDLPAHTRTLERNRSRVRAWLDEVDV